MIVHQGKKEAYQDRRVSGIRARRGGRAMWLVAAEHWLRNAAGIKVDPGLVLANL
jgi:hypothetical protein